MLHYYIAFLPLLPFTMFALLLFAKKWIDDHRWTKVSGEKHLRSPGESRRQEIDSIDSSINDCLMYIGIGVAVQIIAFTFLTSTLNGTVLSYILSIVSVGTVSYSIWYLSKTCVLVLKRSRCADGLHGERLAGDQLSVLMLEGYRVFHDLQFDGINIDHALVGPGGVFSIETHLRRKGKKLKKKEAIVSFDGEKLHWPNGKANEIGLQDALDRSITLKKYLSKALGGTMEVKPLLLFPGWTVETEQKGEVDILSPRQVHAYLKGVEDYCEVIPERLINRICRHIAVKAGYPEPMTTAAEDVNTKSEAVSTPGTHPSLEPGY